MKNRFFFATLGCAAVLSCSGCVSGMAHSDATMRDNFQPLIGVRSSVYMMGEFAQHGLLRLDNEGHDVPTDDAVCSLLLVPAFAADLPATAAADLLLLPSDVQAEFRSHAGRHAPSEVETNDCAPTSRSVRTDERDRADLAERGATVAPRSAWSAPQAQ